MAVVVSRARQSEISNFYLDYLSDAEKTFEDAMTRLKNCDISQFTPTDAINMSHRIKGNAAMYGYAELGLQAAETEAYLRNLNSRSSHATTLEFLAKITQKIQDIRNGKEESVDSSFEESFSLIPVETSAAAKGKDIAPQSNRVIIAYKDIWISQLMSSLFGADFDVTICQTEGELFAALGREKHDLLILEDEFGQEETDEGLFLEVLLNNQISNDLPIFVTFEPNSPISIAKTLSLGIENFSEDKYEVLDIVLSAKSILEKPSQRVLVVDDDPIVRDLLSHVLTSKGLVVDTVDDGLEALSYLTENTPDIVLLDRFMPRLEGGTVLYEIQNKINLKSIPVLILTAMVNQGEATSWFERGAADFIPKPFDPEEVLMRVMQHLERTKTIG